MKLILPQLLKCSEGYPESMSRKSILLVLALGLLTVFSLLPIHPQGPFDARDDSRIEWMKVEISPWGAVIEPLAAPILILAGAPDFRLAAASTLFWTVLGAVALHLRKRAGINAEVPGSCGGMGRKCEGTATRLLLGPVTAAFGAAAFLALIIFFSLLARLPGWQLVVERPDMIVADLQSHTLESWDGLASLRTNLSWHSSSGYQVVAITDHAAFPGGAITARPPVLSDPSLITGVEINGTGDERLLGIWGTSRCQGKPAEK